MNRRNSMCGKVLQRVGGSVRGVYHVRRKFTVLASVTYRPDGLCSKAGYDDIDISS